MNNTEVGISDDDKQHLFERFFRAKNAFNTQGTGLGLHIVAKYLELMNGTIEVESELNKGTVPKNLIVAVNEATILLENRGVKFFSLYKFLKMRHL